VSRLTLAVRLASPNPLAGTGWTFPRAEANPLRESINHGLQTYRHNRPAFRQLQLNGMNQDLSWDNAAKLYEDVMVEAKYQW